MHVHAPLWYLVRGTRGHTLCPLAPGMTPVLTCAFAPLPGVVSILVLQTQKPHSAIQMCRANVVLFSYYALFNSATPWTSACQVSLHYLTEFAQIHIHQVNNVIQPSHPLSLPSPIIFDIFQYQGFFQWVGTSHQVAKVLELLLQHQSFQ